MGNDFSSLWREDIFSLIIYNFPRWGFLSVSVSLSFPSFLPSFLGCGSLTLWLQAFNRIWRILFHYLLKYCFTSTPWVLIHSDSKRFVCLCFPFSLHHIFKIYLLAPCSSQCEYHLRTLEKWQLWGFTLDLQNQNLHLTEIPSVSTMYIQGWEQWLSFTSAPFKLHLLCCLLVNWC